MDELNQGKGMRFYIFVGMMLYLLQGLQVMGADEVKPFEKIHATQLRLSNGMVVCLKPTDYEGDEVYFKLAALGGYASLDAKERPSGQLAAQFAWESGLGDMSSDQVSVYLYEHSLEFSPSIRTFSRVIDGEGSKEGIEAFLRCVNLLFTQQKFTKEGWEAALSKTKTILRKQANDHEHVYEAFFLAVNTQQLAVLQPLKAEDLERADFQKSKDIFHRSFSNPSDFVCVIVGNFEVDRIIEVINKNLGTIPKAEAPSGLNQAFSAPFPPGITKVSLQLSKQTGSLTRLTFPMQIKVQETNLQEIGLICQIIEARLRRVITEKMALSYGVDVSYEFPLYPLLDNPWISIRYRCEEGDIEKIRDIILLELGHLQTQGVSQEEVKSIKKLEFGSQEFWLRDNFYWLSMLTNYYLWGWNPQLVDFKNTSLQELSVEAVNDLLKKLILLSNYSVITALPQEQ